MDKLDGVTALALILIASFAIDRIVTGVLFLLSFSRPWSRHFPDPASLNVDTARSKAEKKQKLVYFILAGIFGIVVLAWLGDIRIFSAVVKSAKDPSLPMVDPTLDRIITGLVLAAGADRLAQVLKMPGSPAGEKVDQKPIQVTGKLTIEDEAARLSGTIKAGRQ